MASDEAVDLLGDLPYSLAGDLIGAMPREDQQEVASLLAHARETAGGLNASSSWSPRR